LLDVVLCWHMHQPHYRDGLKGEFHLPWVYLHGIKDYADMATHLENHPQMKTVVNFSPVLLEQIDDYVQELHEVIQSGFSTSAKLSDPMLSLIAGLTPIPKDIEARKKIVEDCQRCHAPRMIEPYPAFSKIMGFLDLEQENDLSEMPYHYLDEQYYIDLMVWYHLAWLGFSVKKNQVAEHLFAKQYNFSQENRQSLITLIHDTLKGLIPRYRRLAESEQIEISLTPYTHPIIPLLNDFENMRCSLPDAPAPNCENYPGGHERSEWHMQVAIDIFKKHFGFKPQGVWLSEGGVSDDALDLLNQFDITWTATGEAVWRNTYRKAGVNQEEIDSKKALFKAINTKTVRHKSFLEMMAYLI